MIFYIKLSWSWWSPILVKVFANKSWIRDDKYIILNALNKWRMIK